jgi:hypothetical protein
VRQALRSWAFWNLTGGTALRLLAKTGATVHIIPILASKGVSEQTAAFLLGAQLFLTVPLYLLLGWAADRFPKPPVLMGASLAGTAAFALLASPWQGRGLLLAYVVLFSLCDASAPTNWAVVGEYFGRQTFSRLRGYIQFATFPGALGAPVFLGWWYDQHHSYTVPLWLYTGGVARGGVDLRGPQAASQHRVGARDPGGWQATCFSLAWAPWRLEARHARRGVHGGALPHVGCHTRGEQRHAGQGDRLILTIRTPFPAGCRALTLAETLRLSPLLWC